MNNRLKTMVCQLHVLWLKPVTGRKLSGFDGYLSKPINPGALDQELERLLLKMIRKTPRIANRQRDQCIWSTADRPTWLTGGSFDG